MFSGGAGALISVVDLPAAAVDQHDSSPE